jgi:hypothetical protein
MMPRPYKAVDELDDLEALQPDIDRIGFTFDDVTATASAVHNSAAPGFARSR